MIYLSKSLLILLFSTNIDKMSGEEHSLGLEIAMKIRDFYGDSQISGLVFLIETGFLRSGNRRQR
jgi:hypothetical protein